MRNRMVDDILDLCDDQGIRHEMLAGRTGVRVFPKLAGSPPAILYFNSPENGHEAENQKARMRRIGLRFPIDEERARVRATKQKDIAMAVNEAKSNGGAKPVEPWVTPPALIVHANPFTVMREKVNAALTALSELEASIDAAEAAQKPLTALRDLLRQAQL